VAEETEDVPSPPVAEETEDVPSPPLPEIAEELPEESVEEEVAEAIPELSPEAPLAQPVASEELPAEPSDVAPPPLDIDEKANPSPLDHDPREVEGDEPSPPA
jgi:hypothetical protein